MQNGHIGSPHRAGSPPKSGLTPSLTAEQPWTVQLVRRCDYVPDYRLYFLNDSGHVRHALNLPDCNDDAHAIAVITESLVASPMELWQGDRLVRVFGRRERPNS